MLTLSHDQEISLDDIVSVAHGARVNLAAKTAALLKSRREEIVNFISASKTPAYGFNRGFGHNVDLSVAPAKLAALQKNLIRSHAAGLGPVAPVSVVRATMLLRAQSLSRGHSGVRPAVVQALLDLLNCGITPAVPLFGSVGASGDLAPLSHIALALIGEGQVFVANGSDPVPAARALKQARLKPLELQIKEGIALNNGVQYSTAFGILCHQQLRVLYETALIATAFSAQVMLGGDSPFEAELHALRPHPGAKRAAATLWKLMQGSPMRESHKAYEIDGEIQDPYNLRCAAQILGTCEELLTNAAETLRIEANSVTDNPLLLRDAKGKGKFTRILSGGHFHGMPIAVKLFDLLQACGIMGRLSNMRCVRYVDQCRNKGLGSDLVWPRLSAEDRAISSGMMLAEYASAALTNFIWGECMPNHLFSLSTDAGQEDHVSMSANLAVKLWSTLPRLAEVLGIELAFAQQAYEIRKVSNSIPSKHIPAPLPADLQRTAKKLADAAARKMGKRFEAEISVQLHYKWEKKQRRLSPACEKVSAQVSKIFPRLNEDREISSQLQALANEVWQGTFVRTTGRAAK
ncbi:MAG: aromatic amino acid ammonia-lyase [Oligoflexia bacterium]|nr:aromatic amino acid ammonia-lyase [Oligoflexia bacterium]